MIFTRPIMSCVGLIACVALLLSIAGSFSVQPSVIGIDFGTDWLKVSMIKTGTPLDIVFNSESKRKTPTAVTIREGVRYYGSESINLETRFPQDTYARLKSLLGQKFDGAAALQYRSVFQNTMVLESRRGGVAFKHESTVPGEEAILSVEELVALLLDHARDQAETAGKEPVSGAVITVPPFFTQIERQALLDAAKIAKLPVLGLMSDETAVALNYAVSRSFPVQQNHIFYDMGAGSTVAAVVQFDALNSTKSKTSTPVISVKSIGYDKNLGGTQFDVKLQQFLAAEFTKTFGHKVKAPIQQDARAMARLYKEANRVKQVLSANSEALVLLESLYEDIDFRLLVSRKEFEAMCTDLFSRIAEPINTALKRADLLLEQVDSLVLVGGNVRIPKVQQLLAELVGEQKIAQHVNGDESAVMGAGLQAARLSKRFRVREILVEDLYPYSVAVQQAGNSTYTEIFAENSRLGSTKSWAPRVQGSALSFAVSTRVDSEHYTKLFDAVVPNLEKSRAEILEKAKQTLQGFSGDYDPKEVVPKLKVQLQIEPANGLVKVKKAILDCEFPNVYTDFVSAQDNGTTEGDSTEGNGTANESIGSKIWNFFSKNNVTNETELAGNDSIGAELNRTLFELKGKAAGKKAKVPVQKLRYLHQRFPLTVSLESSTFPSIDDSTVEAAQARMSQMDREDEQRVYKANVHNELEASVYRIRDLMDSAGFAAVSTEAEREDILEKAQSVGSWLEDEAYGDSVPVEIYLEKQRLLDDVMKPLMHRKSEMEMRERVVGQLQKLINETKIYLTSLKDKPSAEQYHSDAELTEVGDLVESTQKWLKEKLKAQSLLSSFEDPTLLSGDIAAYQKSLSDALQKLVRKIKVKPSSLKASSSTTETAEASNTETETVDSKTVPEVTGTAVPGQDEL